ncbi:MAG TPA: FtsX-like permease family protein [Bacillales bacterium]|nr:FtsX-like permease family protein [Bacillales bacterium]
MEKSLGVVEDNYLSVGSGGISIDEWKDVQNLEDVSVAAPVAAIGYFTGWSKSFAMPMPVESIRSKAQFYTSNGIDNYPIGLPKIEIMLKKETKGKNASRFSRLFSKNKRNGSSRGPPMYNLPQTYHLLVGIDPDSEEKLTGISFKGFKEDLSLRKERMYNRNFSGAPIVKILKLKEPNVPIRVEAERFFLGIDAQETVALTEKFGLENFDPLFKAMEKDRKGYYRMFDYLKDYPAQRSNVFQLDFSKELDPFKSIRLRVNKEGEIVKNKKYGSYYHYGKTTIYYTASDIKYRINTNNHVLSVNQFGKNKGVPVYRSIKKKGKHFALYQGSPPFFLAPVGAYEIGKKEEKLSASPLGIYSLTPTVLASTGEELHATIYPGSFVSAPAHGVTTIKSAKIIKGAEPIDAIRVRVAGIDGYTEAAAEKIKDVARKIAKMGFEVDVVAGASHQQMKVKVDGIGTVLEPWTTLGAAATIVTGWNGTTVILAVSFTVVALIYLLGRMLFAKVERQEEVALLSQLGWERKHIARKMRAESTLLTVVALAVAMGAALLLQESIDIPSYVYWIQLVLFVLLIGFFTAAMRGSTVKETSNSAISTTQPGRFIRKNLRFYRSYIQLPFIQLVMVSCLSTFVYLALRATVEQTDLTVLGQYVSLQAGSFYKWIIAGAYILALFTVAEALASLLQVRHREVRIFQSIGWDFRHIYLLLFSEIALWTGIATGFGAVLSFVGFVFLYGFALLSFWVIPLSFAALYAAVLIVASLLLWFKLRKNIGTGR